MENVKDPTTFKDDKGREWKLKLSVGLIEDIKDDLKIDLDELMREPKNFATVLFTEPKQLVSLLYFICKEQAEQVPLNPREFGRMFTREMIDEAANALLAAVLLFYPRTSAGNVLTANLPRVLREMDAEIARRVSTQIETLLSPTPTDSRELLG